MLTEEEHKKYKLLQLEPRIIYTANIRKITIDEARKLNENELIPYSLIPKSSRKFAS